MVAAHLCCGALAAKSALGVISAALGGLAQAHWGFTLAPAVLGAAGLHAAVLAAAIYGLVFAARGVWQSGKLLIGATANPQGQEPVGRSSHAVLSRYLAGFVRGPHTAPALRTELRATDLVLNATAWGISTALLYSMHPLLGLSWAQMGLWYGAQAILPQGTVAIHPAPAESRAAAEEDSPPPGAGIASVPQSEPQLTPAVRKDEMIGPEEQMMRPVPAGAGLATQP